MLKLVIRHLSYRFLGIKNAIKFWGSVPAAGTETRRARLACSVCIIDPSHSLLAQTVILSIRDTTTRRWRAEISWGAWFILTDGRVDLVPCREVRSSRDVRGGPGLGRKHGHGQAVHLSVWTGEDYCLRNSKIIEQPLETKSYAPESSLVLQLPGGTLWVGFPPPSTCSCSARLLSSSLRICSS